MANLFTSWVGELVDHPENNENNTFGHVQSFTAPVPGEKTRYEFDGNRAELIAAGPLTEK